MRVVTKALIVSGHAPKYSRNISKGQAIPKVQRMLLIFAQTCYKILVQKTIKALDVQTET